MDSTESKIKTKRPSDFITYTFLCSFSFICCYLIISYFNRHSSDDFLGISHVSDKGAFGAAIWLYFNWEGSYAQGLTFYPLSAIFGIGSNLMIFNILNLLFIIIGVYALISSILKIKNIITSIEERILISILIISSFFIVTVNVGENWFWLNGSSSYLTPLGFLALGLSFYINKKYLLSAICLFWFCGFRFNYSIFLITLFSFINLYQIYQKKSLRPILTNALIWIFIFIGTTVYIIAPGNYVRKQALEQVAPSENNFSDFMIHWSNFSDPLLIRIPFFILVSFPVIIWLNKKGINFKSSRIFFTFSSFFILTYMLIHFTLMSVIYKMYWFGEQRTWLIIQIIFYSFLVMLIGRVLHLWITKHAVRILMFCTFISIAFYSIKIIPAIPSLNNYATAYDQRIHFLLKTKNNNYLKIDTLKIESLPSSFPEFANNSLSGTSQSKKPQFVLNGKWAYLRDIDISKRSSSGGWINEGIEKAFDLPFILELKE